MAAVGTFEALVFVLVVSSRVAVSNGYCNRYSSSSCNAGYVCCNNNCVYGTDCSGQTCTYDSDCSSYELSCCSSTCKAGDDCIGYSCSVDSDCDTSEYCCHGVCSYNSDCYYVSYYDPTGAIVGTVFGVVIFICLVSLCIFYAYRRRQTRPGRVIVGQRVTATTVTTRHVTQANQPYQGQMPPYGQQGYPYHPPPQYEQHQTAIPPPYSPGTTAANDQPPPYNVAAQGRSGGVYSPQTSYGAVQPPSAKPGRPI